MSEYVIPGVAYERLDTGTPGIATIRTDVAGFVGIAERGPLHRAVALDSWRQFQAVFGGFTGAGFLAYAVRGFFENGGARCWVVRIASEWAAPSGVVVRDDGAGAPAWRIEASSPGAWGDRLDVDVREVRRAQTRSAPERSAPEALGVDTISGFTPGTLVRLSQNVGGISVVVYRVVRAVDALGSRLVFWHDEPRARAPYDAVVSGVDLGRPILVESVAYRVLVRERGRLLRVYDDLSPLPEHARYAPALLAGFGTLDGAAPSTTPLPAPEPIAVREQRDPNLPLTFLHGLAVDPALVLPLRGGVDGLSGLAVRDFTGEALAPEDSDELRAQKRRGLRALEEVGEVALLAVPDINIQPVPVPRLAPLPPCPVDPCLGTPAPFVPPPSAGDLPPRFDDDAIYQVQQAMIDQCERRRDRVALLDPPRGAARADGLGLAAPRAWRARFDSKFAALAHPWLRVRDPLARAGAVVRELPPSGHVAGICAGTELRVGVHKAPANVAIVGAEDATVALDDVARGVLNPLGINAIASSPGGGLRLMGARTLSSDPDFVFLNVRRLLIMLEKAIGVAIQWAAFEPNDLLTRTKLHLVLTTFLLALWQRGALAGASPAQAFFVKCDEQNNPASARERGELHIDVGVAPSKPFEFVVLRVGRSDNEFETTEVAAGVSGRGGL